MVKKVEPVFVLSSTLARHDVVLASGPSDFFISRKNSRGTTCVCVALIHRLSFLQFIFSVLSNNTLNQPRMVLLSLSPINFVL
jgi:hypothetical protein